MRMLYFFLFFFFNDTATTEIYTLSLHDALPIYRVVMPEYRCASVRRARCEARPRSWRSDTGSGDRKSTRLNSSHLVISYAVFCLKKKKKYNIRYTDLEDTCRANLARG